jgi:alpha-methylacyl-CoA racemase
MSDLDRFPLRDVRIVDFTRMLPGALATLRLADLGAQVIKVESPPEGDPQRRSRPLFGQFGAAFMALNRDKQFACLDHRTQKGRGALIKLIRSADVFVESSIPGSLKKFGLDFVSLRVEMPRLVYCSISGYGLVGEYAEHPSHGITLDARAGYLEVERDREGRAMAKAVPSGGLRHSVLHAGHAASAAICAALYAVERYGSGRHIDVSCWDSVMTADPYRGFQELNGVSASYGTDPARPTVSVFETSDRSFIAVAVPDAASWGRFCDAVGRPEFGGAFETANEHMGSKGTGFYDGIAAALKAKTVAEWEAVFVGARVACGPVQFGGQRFESDLARSRTLERTGDGNDAEPVVPTRWIGSPRWFGQLGSHAAATPAGSLGRHTQGVLEEIGLGIRDVGECGIGTSGR